MKRESHTAAGKIFLSLSLSHSHDMSWIAHFRKSVENFTTLSLSLSLFLELTWSLETGVRRWIEDEAGDGMSLHLACHTLTYADVCRVSKVDRGGSGRWDVATYVESYAHRRCVWQGYADVC